MNTSVLLFFLHNVFATFLLGMKFAKKNDSVFRNFGYALLLDSVAFAAWLFGILNPASLVNSVTVGAVFMLASFVFMLNTSMQSKYRAASSVIGILAVIAIFFIGHSQPDTAYISSEGLFFFNLGPLMQMLYIFALALAAFPAIDVVASKFKSPFSLLVRYGFIAEVVAGIMLIISKDMQVLYIVGWIIGLIYFALWTTLLFNRKSWASVSA